MKLGRPQRPPTAPTIRSETIHIPQEAQTSLREQITAMFLSQRFAVEGLSKQALPKASPRFCPNAPPPSRRPSIPRPPPPRVRVAGPPIAHVKAARVIQQHWRRARQAVAAPRVQLVANSAVAARREALHQQRLAEARLVESRRLAVREERERAESARLAAKESALAAQEALKEARRAQRDAEAVDTLIRTSDGEPAAAVPRAASRAAPTAPTAPAHRPPPTAVAPPTARPAPAPPPPPRPSPPRPASAQRASPSPRPAPRPSSAPLSKQPSHRAAPSSQRSSPRQGAGMHHGKPDGSRMLVAAAERQQAETRTRVAVWASAARLPRCARRPQAPR